MNEFVDMMMENKPDFHEWRDGKTANWSVDSQTLKTICSFVKPGMATLETGAGATTVIFAKIGTKHTCITPAETEAFKIQEYCKSKGITAEIDFIIQPSDVALPNISNASDLDFVFLDGAHKFPIPFIDWHYTECRVKIGGIIAVDDFRMPSVRMLYDFMCIEDEWELKIKLNNVAFFQRTKLTNRIGDWPSQKINAKKSKWIKPPYKYQILSMVSTVKKLAYRVSKKTMSK